MKKRAIVYIDGYNLYYGLIRGTCDKWLDLRAFARALLREDFDLTAVKYFTAPVKTHPHDLAAIDRQKVYLQALTAHGGVETVLGFYSKNKTLLPLADARCGSCPVPTSGMLPVYKLEEKRSDVNLAVAVVTDAATDAADCLLLVTGDSDQVGAIETARYRFGKTVVVFNPHASFSVNLKTAASYYQNIPRDLPARCQLPEVIPVGTHGRVIRRPAAWS